MDEKHLRIIAATWIEVQILPVDSDERLALWPIEASYSQAKTEVHLQYISLYSGQKV